MIDSTIERVGEIVGSTGGSPPALEGFEPCEVCDDHPAAGYVTGHRARDALDLEDGEQMQICTECKDRLWEILHLPTYPGRGWNGVDL